MNELPTPDPDDSERIPTGSFPLDRILNGGIAKGRLIELSGPKEAGKSRLALSILRQAQAQGSVACYIDTKNALDLRYARSVGIDCSKMLLSCPDSGGPAMDVLEGVIRSGQVGIVVLDDVANLRFPPSPSNYEEPEDTPLLRSRRASRAIRKLASLAYQTGTTVVLVNSDAVGEHANACKFYSSQRIQVRCVGKEHYSGVLMGEPVAHKEVGATIEVTLLKDKMEGGVPFRRTTDTWWFTSHALARTEGFDRATGVFDLATDLGVVTWRKAFYFFAEQTIGQGRYRAIAELIARPELCEQIAAAVEAVKQEQP